MIAKRRAKEILGPPHPPQLHVCHPHGQTARRATRPNINNILSTPACRLPCQPLSYNLSYTLPPLPPFTVTATITGIPNILKRLGYTNQPTFAKQFGSESRPELRGVEPEQCKYQNRYSIPRIGTVCDYVCVNMHECNNPLHQESVDYAVRWTRTFLGPGPSLHNTQQYLQQ